MSCPDLFSAAEQEILCEACGDATTFADSAPRGTNPLKRWGKDCLAADKARLRNMNNPVFAQEWKSKNKKDMEEWYKENKKGVGRRGKEEPRRQFQGERVTQEKGWQS